MDIPRDLVRGDRYRVVHRIEGVQRYDRVSVLQFLAYDDHANELIFNARPVAGTTALGYHSLKKITRVDPATPIFINRRA
jgi:hypothetical protein